MPQSYVYPSPYLTAPGGLVLPPSGLTHAGALASQFYEYQNLNAAASLASFQGTAAYPVDHYPYTTAAAAAGKFFLLLYPILEIEWPGLLV